MNIPMCTSQINFKGNVIITTQISKKAKKTQKFLADILEQKHNSKSFKEIMQQMPFDVYISCKNPSKKAINPCLTVFLEKKETKEHIGLYSLSRLKSNQPNEIERIHNITYEFAKACEENKNKSPFNKREANMYLAEQILSGFFNKK